jgi:hypothetical protein
MLLFACTEHRYIDFLKIRNQTVLQNTTDVFSTHLSCPSFTFFRNTPKFYTHWNTVPALAAIIHENLFTQSGRNPAVIECSSQHQQVYNCSSNDILQLLEYTRISTSGISAYGISTGYTCSYRCRLCVIILSDVHITSSIIQYGCWRCSREGEWQSAVLRVCVCVSLDANSKNIDYTFAVRYLCFYSYRCGFVLIQLLSTYPFIWLYWV